MKNKYIIVVLAVLLLMSKLAYAEDDWNWHGIYWWANKPQILEKQNSLNINDSTNNCSRINQLADLEIPNYEFAGGQFRVCFIRNMTDGHLEELTLDTLVSDITESEPLYNNLDKLLSKKYKAPISQYKSKGPLGNEYIKTWQTNDTVITLELRMSQFIYVTYKPI
jgi:hypothetical protein